MKKLNQHLRNIHENSSNLFSCTECDYFTSRKHDLKGHMKRHTNTPATSNLPPKIACCKPIPNIIEPTKNKQLLRDIEQQELTDMLNIQASLGLSQIPPHHPHLQLHLPTTTTLDNKNLNIFSD